MIAMISPSMTVIVTSPTGGVSRRAAAARAPSAFARLRSAAGNARDAMTRASCDFCW